MKARRSARRLALEVLYEAEIRDALPVDVLDSHQSGEWVVPPVAGEGDADETPGEQPGPDVTAYARTLVEGIQKNHAEIDGLIARYADRWTIERMPVVDRTILRMAILELLWCEDVPTAVAINEAVELAKSLSTEDSGRFVNGLLGRLAESEPPR